MTNLSQLKQKFVDFGSFFFMKIRLNFQLIVFISRVILFLMLSWWDTRFCKVHIISKYNYPPQKNAGLKYKWNKYSKLTWNNQMRKPGIKGLFITKLNYCLLFHFYLFFLYSYLLIIYQLFFWHIKGVDLLSLLIYSIKLSLMKLQVCHNFISFFILPIVTQCLEEIFKKLLSL